MALLNYTTSVAVDKTVGEIQKVLAKNGARSIQVDYDQSGEPVALAFQVETEMGMRGYRLPANIDVVLDTLTRQHQQAARVGWRILKDWTEAQMALLETRMVTLAEIMLPWMIMGRDGATVYQLIARDQLALPSGK